MSDASPVEFEFHLPDPGEGLTEATIESWFVEPGDEVEEGETLLEIETDKALVDIPCPCLAKVIELRGNEGEMKRVGEIIAVLESEDPPRQVVEEGDPASAERGKDAEKQERAEAPQEGADQSDSGEGSAEPARSLETNADKADFDDKEKTGANDRIFAAPSSRSFAAEHGVDLGNVDGSGPGGRITQADIEAHLAKRQKGGVESGDAQLEAEEDAVGSHEQTANGPVRKRPLTGLRRTIANNMSKSWEEIPRVSSGYSVPASNFVEFRERMNERYDANITYTALMVKAVIPALKEFPEINAEIDEENDEIIEKRYYNIGVAANTEAGLIVPVIKHADQKSIVEISKELANIVEQARDRSLNADQLRGSTFTITNTGTHGGESGARVDFWTPIVNHPEVAILGMGRIRQEVVPADDKEVAVEPRLPLVWSYDHRLIDGVTAASFMDELTSLIEHPALLLARL